MKGRKRPLRFCLYGFGAIGSAVARSLLSDNNAEIASVIDTDPKKVGRDLRMVLRVKGPKSVTITDDAGKALRRGNVDVVIHSTGSRLEQIAPQLESIIEAGLPCVTSCEEMAFAEATDGQIARRLDKLAKSHKVALLGTGVNPGFVMDALVLALSGATQRVSHISVERVLDPLSRRRAFRNKVGIGMNYGQASREVDEGRMGHVGLVQSALLVAHGMGWEAPKASEEIHVLYDTEARPKRGRRPNDDVPVLGLQQKVVIKSGSKERIRMEMVMEAGVEAPHDAITITGHPDLKMWIQGGIPGDQATVACLINSAYRLVRAPRSGLLTMLDLPLTPVAGDYGASNGSKT